MSKLLFLLNKNVIHFQMAFNYNSQYPYHWPNSYMPNGYSATSQAHQAGATHPTVPPPPAASNAAPGTPTVFVGQNAPANAATPIPLPPPYSGIVGGSGVFPFGMHGSYQNPSQASHYPPNWNFGYNTCVAHYNQLPPTTVLNDTSSTIPPMPCTVESFIPISQGNSSNLDQSIVKLNTEDQKKSDLAKDAITDDLLALKVSTLLSDSMVLKEAISKSLKNNCSFNCSICINTTTYKP